MYLFICLRRCVVEGLVFEGAAATFFIFAPRGLLVGLLVLALLGARCPQRLLRSRAGDRAVPKADIERYLYDITYITYIYITDIF